MSKYNKSGVITSFFSGIAKIHGLQNVFLHETLLDKLGNPVAIVVGFNNEFVEALFFDEEFADSNQKVFRSAEIFSMNIADSIIGRIVNGIGAPIDELGGVHGKKFSIFEQAVQIIDREPVSEPLQTGIEIIDTSLPLGKGQRELIIGNKKTGKSTIAEDIVLNQKYSDKPVYCIYVLCGQKQQKFNELVSLFEKNNTFLYSVIVSATAGSSFAEQYLAPFVGCRIGEYFRDNGKDALVVYDDLSKHAKIYRDISLLLERAPGRESYPGDIFSLHARLLERAGKKKNSGSLTALPIVETQAGDISAFIPTNIISITDGQIYLEDGLFQRGFLPAVNVGLSVSRVGSKAQPSILRDVVSGIRLALAQHKELQKLSQLETIISSEAKKKIKRGDLILELLKQDKHTYISWEEQVILFYAVENGFFDDIPNTKWLKFKQTLVKFIRMRYSDILHKIQRGIFNNNVKNNIHYIIQDFKQEFLNN